jgi:rRNA pseudouridine-1189 N-methylase Emg1 (Nep1/Mra1 family)
MSETVTLTQEELKEFQGLREEIFETIGVLGDLNYKKTLLEFEIENLTNVIKQNALKEKTLLTGFGAKYGNGSIDVETGIITPIQ